MTRDAAFEAWYWAAVGDRPEPPGWMPYRSLKRCWDAATERAAKVADKHIKHAGTPDDPFTEQDAAAELIALAIRGEART